MFVQDREWFGLQNFLAQANVSDLDCISGHGTERPPKYNGWATRLLATWTLIVCELSCGLALVQVSLRTVFLSSSSWFSEKWKF